MFEPERFPPPRLSGASRAWRYGLALLGWMLVVIGHIVNGAIAAGSGAVSATGVPGGGSVVTGPDPLFSGYESVLIPPPVVAADVILGLALLGIVHLRRRFPLTIFLVVTVVTSVAASGFVIATWTWLSLTSRRHLGKSLVGLVVSLLAALAELLLPWVPPLSPSIVLVAAAWLVPSGLWGAYIGVRRDRQAAVHARVEQADSDREFAVLAERNRIAREMHDVLAHRISLVSMHAGALAFRENLAPEETRAIAKVIQENAHASLTELRSVLSSLREDAPTGPEAPQPTLSDLPALIDEARASGQLVEARVDIAPGLPLVQQRHLYRIVQECLTNARKHAPRARIDLTLGGTPEDGVRLAVANDITQVRGRIPGASLGLVGVTERAHMLGGTLDAGARKGRFVVEAWLPWDDHHRRRDP